VTSFSKAKLLPLIMKLGDYLKAGVDHYATLKAMGGEVDADIIAAFIELQIGDWNPKVGGKALLDAETKTACARFLGGIAINVSK
jgi:hypothetical protein